MSISSELRQLADRIDQTERDARKYRDGEYRFDITFVDKAVRQKIQEVCLTANSPGPVTLTLEFIPNSYETSFKEFDLYTREYVSGFFRLIDIEEKQS